MKPLPSRHWLPWRRPSACALSERWWSFHLKELAHSGLVSSEPRGRNLIYRANFEQMTALLGYLTEHCCQGESCGLNC